MNEEKTTTYTLDQYLEYEEELEKKIHASSLERIYNDCFVHAALVLEALIQKAINDQISMLYMYCGEFSLFRDAKARELSDELNRVKPDESSPNYHRWETFQPYNKLIQTLSSFLNNGGKMMLVVDKDITAIQTENVWNHLSSYFINKRIETYKLTNSIGLNHFFVAGTSYRRERDHDSKKAVCCFNNVKTSRLLVSSHQLLKSISTPCIFSNQS